MAEFKKGDTVRLKSGGPLMTVTNYGESSYEGIKVWCVWFDEKNKKIESTFDPEALEADKVAKSA